MQRRTGLHSLFQVLEADLQALVAPEALEVVLLALLVVVPGALEVGLLSLLSVAPDHDLLILLETLESDSLSEWAVLVVVAELLAEHVHPRTQAVPVCSKPVS